MSQNRMDALRAQYHEGICQQLLSLRKGVVNIADCSSQSSCAIAQGLAARVGGALCPVVHAGQTIGALFAAITKDYLATAFRTLEQIRPGPWQFRTERPITETDQYRHLAEIGYILRQYTELQAALGTDYLITPDIVVYRTPLDDTAFGLAGGDLDCATYTPLRAANSSQNPSPLLHASISCKWTMRSDRAQNTRTEALNLIRNRKGHTPHIVAVTAEPLPTRIASLALGTGDMDCIYHFALYELQETFVALVAENPAYDAQQETLQTLIEGRRLRDISDLPFDLAI